MTPPSPGSRNGSDSAIPLELRLLPNWVVWKTEERGGRATKVPYIAGTKRKAKADDPTTWRSYAEAQLAVVRDGFDGPGYEITEPYVGVDLDCCRNPKTGVIEPWAWYVVRLLRSYTEVTPSGTGLHIWVRGQWQGTWNNRRAKANGTDKSAAVEVYGRGKYFTMTGEHLVGTSGTIEYRQNGLDELAQMEVDFGQTEDSPPAPKSGHTLTATVSEALQALSDDDLIKKAAGAQDGGKFARLWAGDTSLYGGDDSAADMALIAKLLWWTDGDVGRTDVLFQRSALMRPKWDERHASTGETYGQITIRKASSRYQKEPRTQTATSTPEKPPWAHQWEDDEDEEDGGIRKLSDLLLEELPDSHHVVEGIFQRGLTILAGQPKIGKSFLILNVCLALAAGGVALGTIEIQPANVLYLALEDTKKRLQKRAKKILGPGAGISERFSYDLRCPRLNEGGMEHIEEWLKAHGPGAFVAIDVWKVVKPRPAKGNNQNAYDIDYDEAKKLQRLANKYDSAIVVLHHLNKLQTDSDVDAISGSIGFSAAADAFMVMRSIPNTTNAVLRGRGRDVEVFSHALEWSSAAGSWAIVGDAEEVEASKEEQATVQAVREFGKPAKPGDIATALGIGYQAAKKRLWRAWKRGLIQSLSDGAYYAALKNTLLSHPPVPAVPQSPTPPEGDQGYQEDRGSQGDQGDSKTSSLGVIPDNVSHFRLNRCQGTCGGYLAGSETASGWCRACLKEKGERDAELPF